MNQLHSFAIPALVGTQESGGEMGGGGGGSANAHVIITH